MHNSFYQFYKIYENSALLTTSQYGNHVQSYNTVTRTYLWIQNLITVPSTNVNYSDLTQLNISLHFGFIQLLDLKVNHPQLIVLSTKT